MSVVILHLSDIHIKNSNDPILLKGKEIARCTYEKLPNATRSLSERELSVSLNFWMVLFKNWCYAPNFIPV